MSINECLHLIVHTEPKMDVQNGLRRTHIQLQPYHPDILPRHKVLWQYFQKRRYSGILKSWGLPTIKLTKHDGSPGNTIHQNKNTWNTTICWITAQASSMGILLCMFCLRSGFSVLYPCLSMSCLNAMHTSILFIIVSCILTPRDQNFTPEYDHRSYTVAHHHHSWTGQTRTPAICFIKTNINCL